MQQANIINDTLPPRIRISVEGFRAVNNADILIDGITVVAGENGCGKSSISKLLYFLYKTVNNYEGLVKAGLIYDLADISKFIDIVLQDLRIAVKDRNIQAEFRREVSELRREIRQADSLEVVLVKWLYVLNRIENIYTASDSDSLFPTSRNTSARVKFILRDILKIEQVDNDISESFEKIRNLIENRFKKAISKIRTRPSSLFVDELKSIFSDGELPKRFDVFEYDDIIFSLKKPNLSIPYTIQNTIYIDTPMMLSVSESHNIHWDDLNRILISKGSISNNITSIITKEITHGEVIQEELLFSADELKFKRSDGKLFNLLDVATGVKSFSILQLLLKNGILSDKSLLIIDEPESHLHPQWIIEYARLIVMLNKELGVKFFLATHNPDMVSALRYISEREGVLNSVNFYLAENSENEFSYNYKYLNKEIDPIFESFNIAIDRINQYGI